MADLLAFTTGVVHAMTNNPAFPTPTPALSAISAAASDLTSAETLALTRARGTVTPRNDKRGALVALLQQLGGYVQTVADAVPENGAAIIESAGIAVRKSPARSAKAFAVKQGATSGSVTVTAVSVARRAAYEWEYSVDGGKTWITAPATLAAKTTVGGLAAGTSVQFRYRGVTKNGEADWSQPVAIIVK